MTYNGWPNYETWAVYTHLTNTEALYHTAQEMARGGDEILKNYVEDLTNECIGEGLGRLLVQDVVDSFLRQVDWRRLAEALLE